MDEASADQQRNGHEQQATRNGDSSQPEADAALPPYSGPFYSRRLKIVVVLVFLASVTALVLLYLRTEDGDEEPSSARTGSDGVESLHPAQGAQALQQDAVIVDLAPGWDGRLTVDGQPIPETDLTRSSSERSTPAVGGGDNGLPPRVEDRLEFAPGEDKIMRQLPTGRVCVTVEAWQRATGPDGATDTVTWCFTVL